MDIKISSYNKEYLKDFRKDLIKSITNYTEKDLIFINNDIYDLNAENIYIKPLNKTLKEIHDGDNGDTDNKNENKKSI